MHERASDIRSGEPVSIVVPDQYRKYLAGRWITGCVAFVAAALLIRFFWPGVLPDSVYGGAAGVVLARAIWWHPLPFRGTRLGGTSPTRSASA